MGKKRRAAEQTAVRDGYYWFKNFINPPGGSHVDEWEMVQVVTGKVRLIGSNTEIEVGCEYLRNALWVWIEPPHVEGGDSGGIRLETEVRRGYRVARASRDEEHRLGQCIGIVAEGIVGAFTESHDSAAVYHARHPEKRKELVAQIARLIRKVRE